MIYRFKEVFMINPCENCKRKPNCPDVCYPKKDYKRAIKKRARKK